MRTVLALAAALSANAALADDSPAAIPPSRYLGIGRAQPEADPQLTEQRGQWGFAAGATWRYSRHVAFELDVVETGQEADMPVVERSSAGEPGARFRSYINVTGVGGRVKLIYPADRLEPFVGLGIGYYVAEISEYGVPLTLFLPSEFTKRRDNGFGLQFVVGLEYVLSPTSTLGLEYRWLNLEADFGPEFGGPTRVGGGMLLIAHRWYSAPRVGYF